MYVPEHFAIPDPAPLHDLIKQNPFGLLITNGSSGLDANHIPFELELGEQQFCTRTLPATMPSGKTLPTAMRS